MKKQHDNRRMTKKKKFLFSIIFGYLASNIKEDIYILLFGGITVIFTMVLHDIHNNHNDIQSRIGQTIPYTKNISYAIEFLQEDCKNKVGKDQLLQHISMLRTNLRSLLDLRFSLGKLLSENTYCTTHIFISWADQIQQVDTQVCNLPQIKNLNPSNLDNNTTALVKKIESNQITRQGIPSAFYEYFSNAEKENYTHEDCEKLNIKANQDL